jgi:hypothetical protein
MARLDDAHASYAPEAYIAYRKVTLRITPTAADQ